MTTDSKAVCGGGEAEAIAAALWDHDERQRSDDPVSWADWLAYVHGRPVKTLFKEIEQYRSRARAVSAALASTAGAGAGDWVTVPREITIPMRRAFNENRGSGAQTCWNSVLAATPAVPASPISTGLEKERRDEDGFACEYDPGGEGIPADYTVLWDGGTRWLIAYRDGVIAAGKSPSDGQPCISTTWEKLLALASPPAPAEHGAEIRELLSQLQDESDRALACQKRSAVAKSPDFAAYHGGRAEGYQHAARLVAALSPHQGPEIGGQGAGRDGETLETIAAWCEETFGPIEPARIVSRAGEEMDELRETPERVEEAADVVICLARYPGLWDAIERKMAVNRKRRWRCLGDGTGYHIKPEAPSHPVPSPTDAKTGEV